MDGSNMDYGNPASSPTLRPPPPPPPYFPGWLPPPPPPPPLANNSEDSSGGMIVAAAILVPVFVLFIVAFVYMISREDMGAQDPEAPTTAMISQSENSQETQSQASESATGPLALNGSVHLSPNADGAAVLAGGLDPHSILLLTDSLLFIPPKHQPEALKRGLSPAAEGPPTSPSLGGGEGGEAGALSSGGGDGRPVSEPPSSDRNTRKEGVEQGRKEEGEQQGERRECAVCLDEFKQEDPLRRVRSCGHIFHQHCIDTWFATRSSCPVCRINLATTQNGK